MGTDHIQYGRLAVDIGAGRQNDSTKLFIIVNNIIMSHLFIEAGLCHCAGCKLPALSNQLTEFNPL